MKTTIKKFLKRFWDECWVSGHDWEVVDLYRSFHDMYESDHERKVCLKCHKIVDEITPQLRLEDYRKQRRMSREVQAKRIWDNRHKYC